MLRENGKNEFAEAKAVLTKLRLRQETPSGSLYEFVCSDALFIPILENSRTV